MSSVLTVKVPYGRNKEKVFEIAIVPNRFNVDYPLYLAKAQEVIKVQAEASVTKDKATLESIIERLNVMNLEEILEMKYGLIKTLMIANEYEYDRDFWDAMVNPNDVTEMINKAALKDKAMFSKKKVPGLA